MARAHKAQKAQVRAEVTFYTHQYYDKRGALQSRVDAQIRYRDTRTGRLTKSVTGEGSAYIKGLNPYLAGALQRDYMSGRKTASQTAGILRSYGTTNASVKQLQVARDNFAIAMTETFPVPEAQRDRLNYMIRQLDKEDFIDFYKANEYLLDEMWSAYNSRWGHKPKDPEKWTDSEIQATINNMEDILREYLGVKSDYDLTNRMRKDGYVKGSDYNVKG